MAIDFPTGVADGYEYTYVDPQGTTTVYIWIDAESVWYPQTAGDAGPPGPPGPPGPGGSGPPGPPGTNSPESSVATENTLVKRDGAADIRVRLVRSYYQNQDQFPSSSPNVSVAYRAESGLPPDDPNWDPNDDTYIRFTEDKGGLRSWLNVPTRTGGDASGTWGITSSSSNAVKVSAETAVNANRPVAFVDGTGNQFIKHDSAEFYYNPSDNRLFTRRLGNVAVINLYNADLTINDGGSTGRFSFGRTTGDFQANGSIKYGNGSRDKPGLHFYSDTKNGFRKFATNEMCACSNSIDHYLMRPNGSITWSNGASCVMAKSPTGDSATTYYFSGYRSASSISAGGNKTWSVNLNAGTSFSSWLYGGDQRWVHNASTVSSQWDDIKQFQLVNHNWDANSPYGLGEAHQGRSVIGLLAQQVESISPGCVETVMDDDPNPETRQVTQVTNEEGEVVEELISKTEQKSIKIEVVLFKMLGALQEAQARIEELEAAVGKDYTAPFATKIEIPETPFIIKEDS